MSRKWGWRRRRRKRGRRRRSRRRKRRKKRRKRRRRGGREEEEEARVRDSTAPGFSIRHSSHTELSRSSSVHCCFTSIRDHNDCYGRGTQDSHLDFHTAPELWSRLVEVLLYVHRNRRFIRDGSPGRPPRLSHSSWALSNLAPKLSFIYIIVP